MKLRPTGTSATATLKAIRPNELRIDFEGRGGRDPAQIAINNRYWIWITCDPLPMKGLLY
jgi:hypothetical protein